MYGSRSVACLLPRPIASPQSLTAQQYSSCALTEATPAALHEARISTPVIIRDQGQLARLYAHEIYKRLSYVYHH